MDTQERNITNPAKKHQNQMNQNVFADLRVSVNDECSFFDLDDEKSLYGTIKK